MQGERPSPAGGSERELGGIVLVLDAPELGGLPRRDKRTALESLDNGLRVESETVGQGNRVRGPPSAVKASNVLFTSFTREPTPTDPTQTVRSPITAKIGSTLGRAASVPDAKIVSRPCSAGTLLPETGTSMNEMSGRRSFTIESISSVASTPIVLICAHTAPDGKAPNMPRSRAIDMTALASVTMVMQTSTVWTAAAGVDATSAPRSAKG